MEDILRGILSDIYGGDLITAASEAINIPPNLFDNMIIGLSGAIMPIASVLVTIYFMMAVMDKMTSDSFNAEQFIKLMLKLIMSITIIDNAPEWSKLIMRFGNEFTTLLSATAGEFTSYDVSAVEIDSNPLVQIGMLLLMLIPWLVALLMKIAVYFLGYGRAVEIGIRAALSPIGCADIITGGANSNGFRYLKKMIAISMQGGLMMVVIASASVVCASELPDVADITSMAFIGKYLGIMASMVGIMASCKSIANEIVGA